MKTGNDITESVLVNENDLKPIELLIDKNLTFPDWMLLWLYEWDEKSDHDLKIGAEQLSLLVQLFNDFVRVLARGLEDNLNNEPTRTVVENIFTLFADVNGKEKNGHAFVTQCKESVILQRLFLLNSECNSERLTVYENATAAYGRTHPNSNWVSFDKLLTQAFCYITELKLSLKEQIDLENKLTVKKILPHLQQFSELWRAVKSLISVEPWSAVLDESESSFYFINDESLQQLSGDQLVSIVLEESDKERLSPLLQRILFDDALWVSMNQAFKEGTFINRTDKPKEKMHRLEWVKQLSKDVLQRQEIQEEQTENKQSNELPEKQPKGHQEVAQLIELQETCGTLKERLQRSDASLKKIITKLNKIKSLDEKIEKSKAVKKYVSTETQTIDAKEDAIAQLDLDDSNPQKHNEISPLDEILEASNVVNAHLPTNGYTSTETQTTEPINEMIPFDEELEASYAETAALPDKHYVSTETQTTFKPEISGFTFEREQRLKDLASVFHTITLIKKKADNLDQRNHQQAHKAALTLATQLETEAAQYLENKSSLQDFKVHCQIHIHEASQELQKWRGWKQILFNTMLCVLSLGVGYVVAGAINYAVNRQFTFFNATQSVGILKDLNDSVTDISERKIL